MSFANKDQSLWRFSEADCLRQRTCVEVEDYGLSRTSTVTLNLSSNSEGAQDCK